jgi:glutamate-5-semialdehyde dehydrogenase
MSNDAFNIAQAAKAAFEASQLVPTEERITALHAIKTQLQNDKESILAANAEDVLVSSNVPQECSICKC